MTTKKETTFKEAFQQLEKIAEKFEEDEIDLETGIKEFEQGLELAQVCKKKLNELEVQVKEIQEKFDI